MILRRLVRSEVIVLLSVHLALLADRMRLRVCLLKLLNQLALLLLLFELLLQSLLMKFERARKRRQLAQLTWIWIDA